MRLSHLVLWASVFVGELHAFNKAAPFEILSYYNSYKLEYMLLPAGKRKIGTGCTHTKQDGTEGDEIELFSELLGITGICTFDEFVKHILREGDSDRFTVGKNGYSIDPGSNVKDNFNFGAAGETGHDFLYNTERIVPGYEYKGKTELPIATLVDAISDRVVEARATSTLSAEKRAPHEPDLVNKITEFSKIFGKIRLGDQKTPMVNTLEKWSGSERWKDYVTFKTEDIYDVDGKTKIGDFEKFDIDATVEKGGTVITDKIKASILKWSGNYGKPNSGNRLAIRHMAIIEAVNRVDTRLSYTVGPCE